MSRKYSTKARIKQAMATNNNLSNNNKEKYNKNATIGFVLSIISIFGIGLAGLIGFILGIVALTQIKHTLEKGKGLAIAAIIIGFIWSFVISIIKQLVQSGF